MTLTRRRLLGFTAAVPALDVAGLSRPAHAPEEALTVACNVNLSSFDPTVGPSAVARRSNGILDLCIAQDAVVRRLCHTLIVLRGAEIVEAGGTVRIVATPAHPCAAELGDAIPPARAQPGLAGAAADITS